MYETYEGQIDDIVNHLQETGETYFDTKEHTITLAESSNGFEISAYPHGTRPDDCGCFDDNKLIDGGTFVAPNLLEAAQYALQYMDGC